MQILIVDNSIDPDSWGASELCAMARTIRGATIRVRRAPHGDLPDDTGRFDRIIVSGSKTAALEEAPWIDRLDDFLRRGVDQGKAILGVCYGHQSLARALGGRDHVRCAQHGEFGWGTVTVSPEGASSPLMKGLGPSFHTFQWHNDEVVKLAPGMRLLASSEVCPIQAFELVGKPVFGIQFHPERGLEAAERALNRKFQENPEAPFYNREAGKKLYDATVGETIFRNFLAMET